MAIVKRCFICAHKENEDKSCTNPDCPRYKAPDTPASTDKTTTTTNTTITGTTGTTATPAAPAADTTNK